MGPEPGNPFGTGKSLPLLAMAHRLPYVATATVADLHDLEAKVTCAMGVSGARYLHVLVPCPLGWGHPTDETIRIARLAAECGLFPVFEAVDGEVVASTPIRRRVPVDAYLRGQKRFAHLFDGPTPDPRVARLQALADSNIRRFRLQPEVAP